MGSEHDLGGVDGRSCNGATTSGCRPAGDRSVRPGPFTVAVNKATVPSTSPRSEPRPCGCSTEGLPDATNVSGCARPPVTVDVGETPGGIAARPKTNTVYVTGQASNDVAVIDGNTCNARVTSGCRKRPAHVLAGAGASGIAVNEKTNTM